MIKKHFPTLFFILIIIISILMVKPFLKAILFALVMGYIFSPVNRWLKDKLKRKNLAAAITLILIILIALVPTVFLAKTLIEESYSTYIIAKQKVTSLNICEGDGFFCGAWHNFEMQFFGQDFSSYIKSSLENFSSSAVSGLYSFIQGIAESMLHIFLSLFLTFFLLRDGKDLAKKVYGLMPMQNKQKKKSFQKVESMIHAVVFGSVVIALVQGILAAIGFAIFGVHAPLLWGLLVLFASFVPFLGATLVWLPIVLVYLGDAIISSDPTGIGKGIALLLYCFFIVSGIDNILKPKLIGDRTKIHPALIFLGVVGGIYLVGPIGVVVGPVIMALLVMFVKMYEKTKEK